MWMRVASSWIRIGLYGWSLVASFAMPDQFGDSESTRRFVVVSIFAMNTV